MKAEDLMIGDWVDVYHELPDESGFYKPLQVTGLHQNNGICFGDSIIESPWNDPEEFEEEIKPIPLTEEILEKNGFLVDSNGIFYLKENLKFGLIKDIDYGYWFAYRSNNEYICTCDFVHELQHLLKLCKIEKEIKLWQQ